MAPPLRTSPTATLIALLLPTTVVGSGQSTQCSVKGNGWGGFHSSQASCFRLINTSYLYLPCRYVGNFLKVIINQSRERASPGGPMAMVMTHMDDGWP